MSHRVCVLVVGFGSFDHLWLLVGLLRHVLNAMRLAGIELLVLFVAVVRLNFVTFFKRSKVIHLDWKSLKINANYFTYDSDERRLQWPRSHPIRLSEEK